MHHIRWSSSVIADALNLLVVFGDTRLADLHVLLISHASTSNGIIDVLGLNLLGQRSKGTLAEQQVNLLQGLLVRLLEQEPNRGDCDDNVP